jgi:2-keto-4-pentenoate hydratase/2-oxohepta-3-ene-1,7-dioic acid hydratase in catechol pathway
MLYRGKHEDRGFFEGWSARRRRGAGRFTGCKAGSCVVGPEVAINSALDSTGTVDYEGELAIIIGRKAHKVSKTAAYGCIFGYTICNDVTSRELQKRHNQWLIGKSLDTFGPLGPVVVTADEMGDITGHELVTTVNGEVRQQAKIADLIFDFRPSSRPLPPR